MKPTKNNLIMMMKKKSSILKKKDVYDLCALTNNGSQYLMKY